MNAWPATNPTPDEALQRQDTPGRLVVVRDERLADRLRTCFKGVLQVDVLPGALTAMADVANHGAAHVVVPAAALHGFERSAVKTFAEAGVADGLVIVNADAAQAELFSDAGVSRFAERDESDETWREKLGVEARQEPASDDGQEHDEATTRPGSSVPSPIDAGPSVPLTPGHAAALPELGDSDLVEAILEIGAEGGRRAPLLAVALAQQQSDIPGLGFAVQGHAEVPAGRASAEVAYRGRVFGRLHAPPPATVERIEPWAQWLARWVALEQQTRQLRDLAMKDELTGVWNRRYFNRFLRRIIERAAAGRQQVTLLVFDIDNFKTYNDQHGHAAGDEILQAAADLMQSVVRDHDVVARIGGDEFAVIFWDAAGPRREGSSHPDDVLNIAKRFQQAVCELKFPALARADMGTLTISGGLAGFPWDGRTPEDLLRHADLMALESKNKGKNAITFGSGALRCELPRDETTE